MKVTTTNTVDDGIARLKIEMAKKQKEALLAAANALADDIKNVEPKLPVDSGELRDSEQIRVKGDNAVVGYTAPHAVQVHENINAVNWTLSGSGPYFIQSKMVNQGLQEKYAKIVQNIMKVNKGV